MEYIGLLVALLILSAFFSSSETAFLSLQRLKLEHYVREGRAGASTVAALLERPGRLLSAILVGNNLVNTGAAIVGGIIAQSIVSGGLGALLAALTVTVLLVLFGEVGPKTIALHNSFQLTTLYAIPIKLWATIMRPISAGLELLTRAILLATGDADESPSSISESELRMMIGLSTETGALARAEANLLDRVFHFGDRRVHEVMTPRTEAVGIERQATLGEFLPIYEGAPHSRFPVFDESPDKVVGILGIKDILAALSRGEVTPESPVEPLARPAFFVPETKLIGELFREMQSRGIQMAVAVDEWGGTAGIVTIEQLIEEVVGQVWDELRPGEIEVRAIDEHTMQVDGELSVEEARERLGLEIPEGEYDTIAGYVLSVLGHIPKVGETVTTERHRITVERMRNLKIELLRVTTSG